jgi:hypothetical protein
MRQPLALVTSAGRSSKTKIPPRIPPNCATFRSMILPPTEGGVMGKRNWSRGFFRLWVALSLFWILFCCGAAIVDLVRTLRLPPEPPTFALAEQEADKKCGPSRTLAGSCDACAQSRSCVSVGGLVHFRGTGREAA